MVPSNMTSFSQSWKTRCLRMTAMEFFGDAAKSRFLLASFLQGVLCLCRERGGHHPTIVLKGQAGQLKSVGDVNVSSRQITKQRWIWEHLEIQKHVAVECILQVTTKKTYKKAFVIFVSSARINVFCHQLPSFAAKKNSLRRDIPLESRQVGKYFHLFELKQKHYGAMQNKNGS